MIWDEDSVKNLKRMWSDGMSASQIAKRLVGDVTRSAVIGKISRLREKPESAVFRRKHRTSGTPRSNKRKRPAAPRLRRKPKPLPVETPCPEATMQSLMDLPNDACHFPIGNPKRPDFGYCGAPGAPYCAYHYGVVYQKATP